jgi:hypothetical protein
MPERSSDRLRLVRRTIIAGAALFAVVFTLLAGQLWLGNDPALGDGSGRAGVKQAETHASVRDAFLGVVTGALSDDEGRSGARTLRSQTS